MVKMGAGKQWHYNPVTIIQYGLWQLEKFAVFHQKQGLRKAVHIADWLISHVQNHNQLGCIWIYNFSLSFYGPKAPWISAMAQGEAISLLLRLHQILSYDRFLKVARLAIKPFYVPVANGGVLSELDDGCPIFEEFPTLPPPHVLSGHLFALLGLYDYITYFDDDRALLLFENATSRLGANLFRWDTGYWSYYDLHRTRRLASPMFQELHVRLLNVLYEITQKTIYRKYARRWARFQRNFSCKSVWLAHKVWEKIRLLTYRM